MTDDIARAVEMESVEAEREAHERASRTAAAQTERDAALIRLFDPEHESLVYGPFGEIKFGPRGGFEPNVWVGPREHPLLPAMMLEFPKMFEVGAPERVYVCGTCGEQFKSLPAWRGHQTKHKGGAVKG